MRIFRHLTGLPDFIAGTSVAIGNFDGVHRGHQAVIDKAGFHATELGIPLSVITFDPHPRRFFSPDDPQFQLTPFPSKARCLEAMGVENLLLVNFDSETANLTKDEFVDDILIDGLRAKHVTVGNDFVFGVGRSGDVEYLRSRSRQKVFGLSVVDLVKDTKEKVFSSTNIRKCLTGGLPEEAAQLLGRAWEIEGCVIKGDQRGRTIGFPTANISLEHYIVPALGVYAVWAGVQEANEIVWHMGCANIGRRPTFDKTDTNCEVYIFDFSDDIYGKLLRVLLVDYIRPEKKFDGISQIKEQIELDCHDARVLLEGIKVNDVRSKPG